MWWSRPYHSAVMRHRVESGISCQGGSFSVSDWTQAFLQQLTDPLGTWSFQGNSEARQMNSSFTVQSWIFFFFSLQEKYVFTRFLFCFVFSGIVDFSTVGYQLLLQHPALFCKALPSAAHQLSYLEAQARKRCHTVSRAFQEIGPRHRDLSRNVCLGFL